MHLQIIVVQFALYSTLFCLSNGAPPKGSGTEDQAYENIFYQVPQYSQKFSGKDAFTPEEDTFLIKEVYDNPENRRNIWSKIADKHQINVNNKVRGFKKTRSSEKLRCHFNAHLKHVHPHSRSEFHKTANKYSGQEEEFINKELLSDSYQSCQLTDDKLWEDISRKHDLKRQQNCEGFGTKRSPGGLRRFLLYRMRREGRVSEQVKARFPLYFEGHPDGEHETGESSKKCMKVGVFYSSQEDEFILHEASTQLRTSDKVSWKTLAEEHKRNVENNEFGFDTIRSADTLRKHFDKLKRTKPDWKQSTIAHPQRYTAQEEEFINKELLNEAYRSKYLYDDVIWKDLLEKHDIKRAQKCDGFMRKRSMNSLRHHFVQSMRPQQRVSKEIIARFPQNFKSFGAGTSSNQEIHNTDPREDVVPAQDAGENNDVFDSIMRDLASSQTKVDADGIDHSLFVEKGFSMTGWQNDLLQIPIEED